MKLWLTALLALLTISTMTAQSGTASEQNASRVSITLDSNIHSEDVDIWYKMVGDFGGHVSFVRPQPNVRQYFITASFENKPAKEMTVVVYATGCQFEAFEIDLATSEQEVKRQFDCQPLRTVRITGYIDPQELPSDKPVTITAGLSADWLCRFFHLWDCLVPSVHLGQVGSIDPAADGNFEMAIPDFSADPLVNSVTQPTTNALRVGTVLFVLRDKLGRTVAAIRPKGSTPENRDLTIQREYPSPIVFEKVRRETGQRSPTEPSPNAGHR
jgi:hypothetical protein